VVDARDAQRRRTTEEERALPPEFQLKLPPGLPKNADSFKEPPTKDRMAQQLPGLRRERERKNLIFLQWIGLLGAPAEFTSRSWGLTKQRIHALGKQVRWQWIHGLYARGSGFPL